MPKVDFRVPVGAPSLYAPQSLAWQVFKNPVALFIGGITAVLLELAEERVRTGVWEHSVFSIDPIARMRRTGLMAQVGVYGPSELAERLIGVVVRMHSKVEGQTPSGIPYQANDPELLNWVQCTAAYGFSEAYSSFCRPLTDRERDQFYSEALPVARLYLAKGAPGSLAEQRALFESMQPRLLAHPIVFEFLTIVLNAPILPRPFRPLQRMMVRAGIQILPQWVIERLTLQGAQWQVRPWEARMLKSMGAVFERLPLPNSPPVQACRRLGLPGNFLYRGR
jgi:uncharacterized protein (DUF2236 family)